MRFPEANDLIKKTWGINALFGVPYRALHRHCIEVDFTPYKVNRNLSLLRICNFVRQWGTYTSETVEDWMADEAEAYAWMDDPTDDCDVTAQMTVSLANWSGFPRTLLVIGNYGPKEGVTINHAYAAHPTPDGQDYFLMENTGDTLGDHLPLLSEHPEYRNVIAADSRGEYVVWTREGKAIIDV